MPEPTGSNRSPQAPAPEPSAPVTPLPRDLQFPRQPSISELNLMTLNLQAPELAASKLTGIGTHLPTGTSVDIDTEGRLFPTDPKLPGPRGRVSPDGSYELESGEKGNVFGKGSIVLNVAAEGSELFKARSAVTERTNIVTQIRAELPERGQGMMIVGFDVEAKHLEVVGRAATGALNYSVAPQARWVPKLVERTKIDADTTVAGLQDFVVRRASILEALIPKLNELGKLRLYDPEGSRNLRVANISIGISNQNISSDVYRLMTTPAGGERGKDWRIAIFGKDEIPADRQAAFKAIQEYVDRTLRSSPAFAEVQDRYIAATRRLQETGVVITVAAGNRETAAPLASPDYGYNFVAMSPHVVAVAASNVNQTPANFADDFVRISAEGTTFRNMKFAPTVAAPGEHVPVAERLEGQPDRLGVFSRNGSSISAPITAGTFTLMFEANPELSAADAIAIVRRTAVDTAQPEQLEGAGMLDPVRAIKEAKAAR